ncbi:MAG TPA: T9SS type A sorting domain-containing protein, partial [Niastella sp.]
SPAETEEFCPHADYNNAQGGQANVQTFRINFGAPASDYKIVQGAASKNPVACKVVAVLIPESDGSEVGICQIAFEDQRSSTPEFSISNKQGVVIRTFKFPLIRSLKGLKPEYNYPENILPLCTTGNISYSGKTMVKYKRTDNSNEFGFYIPYYEYSVPAGWKVGSTVSTGQNNYIIGGPAEIITYDELHSGEIKIRATQRNYLCSALPISSAGEWATIPFTRPALKLSANGSTPLSLTCGASSPYTFTVENGNLASCLSYQWNLGSDNNNWLYNGNPAPQYISTTSNSLTLTPATCNGKPADVYVTLKVNNTDFTTLNVPVTLAIPTFNISGSGNICNSENYEIGGLPCNAIVNWSISNPSLGLLTTNGNNANIKIIYDGTITLTATITGLCGTGPVVLTKDILMGWPPQNNEIIGGISEGMAFCIGTRFNVYTTMTTTDPPNWRVLGGTIEYTALPNHIYIQLDNDPGGFAIMVDYIDICGNLRVSQRSGTKFNNGCTGGGVETRMQTNQVNVFPNPASNQVSISLRKNNAVITNSTDDKIKAIRIFDALGRLRKQQQYNNATNVTINVNDLLNGIYFVEIINNHGSIRRNLNIKR